MKKEVIKNKRSSGLLFIIFFFLSILFVLIIQTNLISSSNNEIKSFSPNTQPVKSFFVGGGGVSKTSIIQNQNNRKLNKNTKETKINKYHKKYIQINNTAPIVELKEPINNFVSNNGDIEFTYIVHDDGLLKDCTLYDNINGKLEGDKKNKNFFVQLDYPLHFSLKNLPSGNYEWNVVCQDDVGNMNSNDKFSFVVNKISPEVSMISNISLNEDGILMLNLSEYFSDSKGDELAYETETNKNINVKIDKKTGVAIIEPNKNWFGETSLKFIAFDKHDMKVESNPIKIKVSEKGDTPPRFTSLSPENKNVDDDGYIFIECNITDDNGLKEVSLYSDTSGKWNLEETKEVSGVDASVKFNLTGLSNGEYEWACLTKDNNEQEAWSERQKVQISIDVEIKHDIPPYMVNNVDTSRYVIIKFSSYLNDSLELKKFIIKKDNEDIYYEKDMSNSDCIKLPSSNQIVCPLKIRIRPNEIFDNEFRINKKARLNFILEYFYKGQKYEKEIKPEVEVVNRI
jgi:hypothetical protein